MTTATPSYKGYRYPVEIISARVWLYSRFPLSLREVEELMLARGVAVTYETIRRWCAKFGQVYANQLRRRRPRPGDKWHLDEVFVEDQRQIAVPVARGRPARQRARHLWCSRAETRWRPSGFSVRCVPNVEGGSM